MPPANQDKTKSFAAIEKTRHEPAAFFAQVEPPRGVLHANEARGEAFFHRRLAPPPELAAWAQHYWYVQWDLRNVRALQRLFKTYVRVSPKWVIRRYRLHELLERLNSGDDFRGAQLALDLGYADQAHLINDFRALAGYSPSQYIRRSLAKA